MISLIDGDILVYRIGFSCQKKGEIVDSLDIAYVRMDEIFQRILASTNSSKYICYLSGGINYRFKYNPEYKANRAAAEKPAYYEELRDYLVSSWGSEVTDGIEADDAMSIAQMEGDGNTVVCSIDKDLLQIPGNHYNFVRDEHVLVSPMEGLQSFYRQMLIGDTTDNIFGIYGVGPKKAARIINYCDTELDMFERVQGLYDDDERLLMNGRCLWLQRYKDQLWEFPDGAETLEKIDESDPEITTGFFISV